MKLRPYSFKEVIKTLRKIGYQVDRQKGSHIILKGYYKEKIRTVVVPAHKEIAVGTLKGILFQAGLTAEDFIKLTEKS